MVAQVEKLQGRIKELETAEAERVNQMQSEAEEAARQDKGAGDGGS